MPIARYAAHATADHPQVLPAAHFVRQPGRHLAVGRVPDRLQQDQHHHLVRHRGEPLQQRRLGWLHVEQEPHAADAVSNPPNPPPQGAGC